MRPVQFTVALAAFLSTSAFAADLPVKASPPPAPVVVNWTGFYFGGHVGKAWDDTDWRGISFAPTTSFLFETSGLAGGLHAGVNYQIDRWVFGIEGAWTWTDLSDVFVLSGSNSYETDFHSIATVVGRVGYTWDRWMLYVSGGYAAARMDAVGLGLGLPGPFRFDGTDDGWTIGAGLEYMLPNNFSFGADYKYVRLSGSRSGNTDFVIPVAFADINSRIHMASVRLTYKFGSR